MTICTLTSAPISSFGKDEYWLQDYICENTECLGLGKMVVVGKERTQRGGGRLDILLKDIDEDSFYEVEVMLGETDESHIVRSIEYWDLEKKRWPKRQHTAVMVAERINTRFYNVINLLSNAVPIIGIQVNAIKRDQEFDLIFTKIIDTYQEPELDEELTNKGQAKEVPEHVKRCNDFLMKIFEKTHPSLTSSKLKWGFSYYIDGERRAKMIERGNNRITFEIDDGHNIELLNSLAAKAGIVNDNKYDRIRLWMSPDEIIEKNESISEIIKNGIK